MPAGELLVAKVMDAIATEPRTVRQLLDYIQPPVSGRAIRYAINGLRDQGKIKRRRPHGTWMMVLEADER